MMTAWIILIYGALVAAGGLLGYVRAGSLPSLIAGGIAGLGLLISGYLMMRGSYPLGWWVALIIAALLLVQFGARAYSAGEVRLMPGGLMMLLSLVAIIILFVNRAPQTS